MPRKPSDGILKSMLVSAVLSPLLLISLLSGLAASASAAPDEPRAALAGRHVPDAVGAAHLIGRVEATRPIRITFVLPLRDQAGLSDLLTRLYDPNDPQFHHFLSVPEFTEKFGPSVSDVSAVAQYVKAQGLTVADIAPNRVVLQATGPASVVEAAIGVHFNDYRAADGTRFRAPDREPTLPRSVASRLLDIAGTDDLPRARSFLRRANPALTSALTDVGLAQPRVTGTGHSGALSPSDTRQIYGMNGLSQTGTGQIVGVYELDGYTTSDITTFESYYGIPAVPLQNVLIDGFDGVPTAAGGATEVTLDIDMILMGAPSLAKVIVYEADNSVAGAIDGYNRMASDDTASVYSTSWGVDEGAVQSTGNELSAESNAFQEMAMQGQSIFAAAGDDGAYDNLSSISVDDPASQPNVCGVGGTDLTITRSITYTSESAWGNPNDHSDDTFGTGGGGGISTIWPLPSYQSGIATAGSQVSTTSRNVPDVALFSDNDIGGYDIYFSDPKDGPNWYGYAGTSAAAPFWAGFMARVNQARAAQGQGRIGLANTALYAAAKNAAKYAADFHDVTTGSNLYYPAGTGYDLATGLGSLQGAALLADLSPRAGGSSVTWSAVDVGSASDGTGRILWRRSDGVAGLWNVNSSNAVTLEGTAYGPFSDSGGSWTAQDMAVEPQGTSRILWTRSDGAAGVWIMDATGNQIAVGPTYGPYAGWKAVDIAADSGNARVLWRRSDGAAGVWTVNGNGSQIIVGPTYGPYSGWTAVAVGAPGDGTARILWSRSDGAAGLWSLNGSNSLTVTGPTYGPYAGWTVGDLGTASSGASDVLWRNSNGSSGLWTFNASDVLTTIGPTYGPYSGFVTGAMDLAPTGVARILWIQSNRAAGLWSLNSSDVETVIGPTYGPY